MINAVIILVNEAGATVVSSSFLISDSCGELKNKSWLGDNFKELTDVALKVGFSILFFIASIAILVSLNLSEIVGAPRTVVAYNCPS